MDKLKAQSVSGQGSTAQRHGLSIPFGDDPGPDGQRSLIMQRYHTGGTPWTILIDPNGIVQFNAFKSQPGQMAQVIADIIKMVKPDR